MQILRCDHCLSKSCFYLLHPYIHWITEGAVHPSDRCPIFGQIRLVDRWRSYQTKPRQSRRMARWSVYKVHRWRRGILACGGTEAWACAGAIFSLQFDIDDGPAIIPDESSCGHSEPLPFRRAAQDWIRNGNEDDDRQPPHARQQVVLCYGPHSPP